MFKIEKPIKAFWWRYNYPKQLNFGDEVTPFLIKHLFKRRVRWTEPTECDLAGVGSILQGVSDRSQGHPLSIWGSGFIEKQEPKAFPHLSIYAVRGKLTLAQLKDIDAKNIALGDPALLLPEAYTPKKAKRTYKLGIIPHYVDVDSEKLARFKDAENVLIIDVLQKVDKVIDDINSCELILSSSLHGLIVSDAYGVPNYWTPLSDDVYGGGFKFNDYYSVFDRQAHPINIEDVSMNTLEELRGNYIPVINLLPPIQESLKKAFYASLR